jgi:hypothetical protein
MISGQMSDGSDASDAELWTRLGTSLFELGRVSEELWAHGNTLGHTKVEELYALPSDLSSAALKIKVEYYEARLKRLQTQCTLSAASQQARPQQAGVTIVSRVFQADTTYIILWQSLAKGKALLSICSSPNGKRWCSVVCLVESVYGALQGNYQLKDMSGKDIELGMDTFLMPGDYALVPVGDTPLLMTEFERFRIVPGKNKLRTTSAEQSSDSDSLPGKRKSPSQASSSSICREGTFRTALLRRDNHCVVSRAYDSVQACNILACEWWDDKPDRRDILPDDIKRKVMSWPDQIDNIRNGILLSTQLAALFDEGKFSLAFVDGQYRVISLYPSLDKYDWQPLDVNMRKRDDESTWWEAACPDKLLVAFHLRNSAFQMVVAAGPDDFDFDGECEDRCSSPIRDGDSLSSCD